MLTTQAPASASYSARNRYEPNGYIHEPIQTIQYTASTDTYTQEGQQAKGSGYWDPVPDSVMERGG